jgi:hypothetical protein
VVYGTIADFELAVRSTSSLDEILSTSITGITGLILPFSPGSAEALEVVVLCTVLCRAILHLNVGEAKTVLGFGVKIIASNFEEFGVEAILFARVKGFCSLTLNESGIRSIFLSFGEDILPLF